MLIPYDVKNRPLGPVFVVWIGFFGLAWRLLGQVFQRCVEACFGIVGPGLFGRLAELLNLGLLCHGPTSLFSTAG